MAIYSQDGCSTGTVVVFGLGKEERGVLRVGNGQYWDGQDPDGRVPEEPAAQRDGPDLGLAHGSNQPGQHVNHETSCKLEFVVLLCLFNRLQTQIPPSPLPSSFSWFPRWQTGLRRRRWWARPGSWEARPGRWGGRGGEAREMGGLLGGQDLHFSSKLHKINISGSLFKSFYWKKVHILEPIMNCWFIYDKFLIIVETY